MELKTLDRIFKEIQVGSEVTFKNLDPVAAGKTWGSENTIKLGENLFIAHGVGGDGIVTREDIEKAMATGIGRAPDKIYTITHIRINAIVEFNLN